MDLATNRKARFDYEILDSYEAGIQLSGHEVKSLRTHHGTILGAFVIIRGGEAFLVNAQIPPYQTANTPSGYDPTRARRLLLKRSELNELIGASSEKGLTMVPLSLYTKKSRIKLSFGLARRKKKHDKREKIRAREDERKINRALRDP